MRLSTALLTLLATSLFLLACRSSEDGPGSGPGQVRAAYGAQVAPPLEFLGSAYELAGELELPELEPGEAPGLHNVFHLSEAIVSGSEPHGRAAFEQLAAMGIVTIVSVDGKVPDAATAAELGMRYVHIPIQYKGITDDELLRLAKTFRELPGPFYVHCFHGRHRGPAGAALGRMVFDELSRDLAIAEMRQYSGTSKKYEGLYRVVASGSIPTRDQTQAYEYDFEAAHLPDGLVEVMVGLSRAHDNIALLSESDWRPDAEHPDLDALNEAEKLAAAYEAALDLDGVLRGPVDQREWFEESREAALQLTQELRAACAGDAAASERALQAFLTLKADCANCHKAYRN